VPLANVIGGPISGWLLGVEGHGLHGWQWMLMLEGIPSLLCGIATLWVLPDGPAKAKWLSGREKDIIAARLAADSSVGALHGFKEMLLDKRIWILMIPDFSIVIGLYGLNLWQPQMIKAMGYTNIQTGFIISLPYLLAMGAMVALGWSSDKSGERAGHVAFGAFAGAAGMAGAVLLTNHAAIIASLCVACCGIYAALAVFWTLPSSLLRGTAAAAGLALLNSFSNLGGFFGPFLMGWARQITGNFTLGMLVLSGMLVLAGFAVLVIGRALFPRSAA
jgi:MFS transporter, ACS family, tartrate transporter